MIVKSNSLTNFRLQNLCVTPLLGSSNAIYLYALVMNLIEIGMQNKQKNAKLK